ncbi:MAG TPA: hypothetical protein VJY33_12215 [Isosphaeraceae bacterium]|nr:hypothetical protein [Isosphaeraceae bacterium]
MSRNTRRAKKQREKRLMRRLDLLEQANVDPKRRNRKTRKRELVNLARTDLARTDAAYMRAHPGGIAMLQEVSNANEA